MTGKDDTISDGAGDRSNGSSGRTDGGDGPQPVGSVPGINENDSIKLASAGVVTVNDLLAADPTGLSSRTDIPESSIREWIDAATSRSTGPGGEPGSADEPPRSAGIGADPVDTDDDASRGTTIGADTIDPDDDPGGPPIGADPVDPDGDDSRPTRIGADPVDSDDDESRGTTIGAEPGPRDAGSDGFDEGSLRTPDVESDREESDAGADAGTSGVGGSGSDRDDGGFDDTLRTPDVGTDRESDGPEATSIGSSSTGGSAGGREAEPTVSPEPASEPDRTEGDRTESDDGSAGGTIFCQECGNSIDAGAEFCPECGTPQEVTEEPEADPVQEEREGRSPEADRVVDRHEAGTDRRESRGTDRGKDPRIAGAASLAIPGAGQAYTGRMLRAGAFLGGLVLAFVVDAFIVAVAYVLSSLVVTGIGILVILLVHAILHSIAAWDAYSGASETE